MSRPVFIFLVVTVMIATVWSHMPPKKCGKNEVWTECGTKCPQKCGQKKQPICPAICVKGCQCKKGYLRNHHNECVRPCECDCS